MNHLLYVLKKIGYYGLIVVLCLAGPGVLLVWKWVVEPNWGTTDVVTAAKTVERGSELTKEHVRIVKMPAAFVVEGAVKTLPEALGKEATRKLRTGEQLTADTVDGKHLVPGSGEWNMPLPAEWIFGKPPGSLLRGDRISLVLIAKDDGRKSDDKTEYTAEKLDRLGIPFEAESKLQHMAVSYAKGTNNQEIASSDDRKKPTGAVSSLEIIATDEQKELIRQYGAKGYKFLIVYR